MAHTSCSDQFPLMPIGSLLLSLCMLEPLLDLGHQLDEHLVGGSRGQDILLGDWWLGAGQ
jgi:hypothetical protein